MIMMSFARCQNNHLATSYKSVKSPSHYTYVIDAYMHHTTFSLWCHFLETWVPRHPKGWDRRRWAGFNTGPR